MFEIKKSGKYETQIVSPAPATLKTSRKRKLRMTFWVLWRCYDNGVKALMHQKIIKRGKHGPKR